MLSNYTTDASRTMYVGVAKTLISAEPRIDKAPYYIEAKNRPNLTRKIKESVRLSPIYREAEKTENVSEKIHFSLVSKRYIGDLIVFHWQACVTRR